MGSSNSYSPYPSPLVTLTCNPASTIFFLIFALFVFPTLSGITFINSITPNFTTSSNQFIDYAGKFLISRNNAFAAQIINLRPEVRSFYLVVTHVSSGTIIWSANRNIPISESSQLQFSNHGLTLYNDRGQPIWSTPEKLSSISSLQLLDSGNLVLVDVKNNIVWESFDYPTDVIVEGQMLMVGKRLVSSASDEDLAEGSYNLVVKNNDALLQWHEMNYWMLSMDKLAFKATNFAVEYMMFNFTGVYLIGDNGKQTVIHVFLNNSDDVLNSSSYFRFAKLGEDGVFRIMKINSSSEQEYRVPDDACQTPFRCGKLGLCSNGGACTCVPPFQDESGDCMPKDGSLALPGPCNGSANGIVTRYLNLSYDADYFSNSFVDPVMRDVNLSACQNLCSGNCSCLGIFHGQSSGSCYIISNYLGSMLKKSGLYDMDRIGYVKTMVLENSYGDSGNKRLNFPIIAIVMPSSIVVMIGLIAAIIWLKRRKGRNTRAHSNLSRGDSAGELDFASFPGLPVRFEYDELKVATEDFRAQLGAGGFGTVYKGLLQDGTEVAVKQTTCLGYQGMREFLMEINAIAKIRHVNLIRLKGFCTHSGQRFLIYEYMNRGSLDRTLFGGEQVLKWKERSEISLGTARGLAYLHTECDQKIIHCDIKPENILLHDKLQVKISDFGLSKLLGPKESGFFSTLRGTRGYIAPEWLIHSVISDKTDVYSYGLVLLEIIRGKRNSVQSRSSISSGESGYGLVYFPLYALEMHIERRYLDLVDPRLVGQVASEEVEKLVRVALCCLHEEPNLRPSMSDVVGMLEGWMPVGRPRIECLSFLRRYDPNEQNELRSRRPPIIPTTSPYKSLSYVSSQQVSGPR